MTASPAAAGLLLVVSASACAACPWYSLSLRGLLAIHWTILNFLFSSYDWQDLTSSGEVLLGLGSVLLLVDAVLSEGGGGRLLSGWEAAAFSFALFSADLAVHTLLFYSRLEIGLVIVISLLFLSAVSAAPAAFSTSFQSRVQQNWCDMFVDGEEPLASFGRSLGPLHVATIAVSTAMQTGVLWLPAGVHSLLFVLRSLGCLSMLFVPANFGGFIQALKTAGRACGSRFAQRDMPRLDSSPSLVDCNGELSLAH